MSRSPSPRFIEGHVPGLVSPEHAPPTRSGTPPVGVLVVDIPEDSFVGRRIAAVRHLDHGPVVEACRKIYQELRCPDTASDMVVNGLPRRLLRQRDV